MSGWYEALSGQDQEEVRGVVSLAARFAVFQMLTVLDGVSVVESTEEKGEFELRYVRGDQTSLLTDPSGEFLHDIFAGAVPPA